MANETKQPSIDRLKAQLLGSGLQQQNYPLFQVINQLIDALRQTIAVTESQINSIISGGTTIPTTPEKLISNIGMLLPVDGENGEPGPIGPIGPRGLQGPIGPIGPPLPGEEDRNEYFETIEPGLPTVLHRILQITNYIELSGNAFDSLSVRNNAFNKSTMIVGGATYPRAASLQFYGESHASFPGDVYIISGGNVANPNSIIELAYRDSGGYHPLVTLSKDGELRIRQTIRFSGSITPAQITADQNDYAPTGHATATMFRLSSDAAWIITGLAGGVDGRMIFMQNIGTNQITLSGENAASTAANRFISSHILAGPGACILCYDGTSSRWRHQSTA